MRKSNKMKASSVESNECSTVDSSGFAESSVLSETLSKGNQSSRLSQSMRHLTVAYSKPVFKLPLIQRCFTLIKIQTV